MQITPLKPPRSSATPPTFDKLSFLKYVKDIGRPYRERAAKLVSICRTFVQAQDKTSDSYYELRSALELVDDALMSAAKAGKKTSEEADMAFEYAVSRLGYYEWKYHPKDSGTVAKKIKMAEEADKSSLKTLNSLEQSRPLEEGPTTEVDFLIHKSLPDTNPTVITQVLCSRSDQNEILWNFSRYKDERRLTLKENPRFYKVLPKLPENYKNDFLMEPIEVTFLEPIKKKSISVLVDKSGKKGGRVFLKITKARAFENAWDLKNAIVFKDVFGKLEGEGIVDAAIQSTPNLWCFTEPPPSHTSRSSNRSSPSPTTVATPTTSSTGLLLTDWREPIRQMLRSPDVNIRISTQPPINSIPISPGPFSPIAQSGFSSSAGIPPPASAERSPRSPARLEPAFKLLSHDQPKAEPALSTGIPLSTPVPPQPPSVAPPSASSATPAQITRPHETQRVFREGSTLGDKIPNQHPGSNYQPKVVTPNPPPHQHAPAAVKTAVPIIQEPQTKGRKKNWFQKHIYDYGK